MDPLAEKYPDWNPYAYTFQNPVNYIDPDGRDGIRIVGKKNKTITIRAVYYLQTDGRPVRGGGTLKGYNAKQIAKMEERTNVGLNKQNLSVNEGEYEGYSIQFDLSFKEGGNGAQMKIKADAEQLNGYDIGDTIQKGDSKSDPNIFRINDDGSQTGGVTDSNKYIMMNTAHDSKSNQIHEIGHTLGLEDNVKTGAKGGLMAYPPEKISQQEANQLGNSDFLPAVQLIQE